MSDKDIARGLGRAQRRVVLSLSNEWGPASDHRTAKRMWYGVGRERWPLVDHKHQTDNVWCLTELGERIKALLVEWAAL